MVTSILLKFLTFKWNISRTIRRIEGGDGSFFFLFFTLFHLSLTFFDWRFPLNKKPWKVLLKVCIKGYLQAMMNPWEQSIFIISTSEMDRYTIYIYIYIYIYILQIYIYIYIYYRYIYIYIYYRYIYIYIYRQKRTYNYQTMDAKGGWCGR